jgi:hypothetical protein
MGKFSLVPWFVGGVGLGEERRPPGADLELPWHIGVTLRVRNEIRLLRGYAVFRKKRAGQQGANVVGPVDPDLLPGEARDGGDA